MCKAFQKSHVVISQVPAILNKAKDDLDKVITSNTPALNLQKHIGEMQGLLDFSISGISETDVEKSQDLTSTYVKTLKENIDDRFIAGPVVVSLLRLFDVTSVPTANKEEFKIFGATDIQTGKSFFPG